jgi:catechol 2,3-dioxygenase
MTRAQEEDAFEVEPAGGRGAADSTVSDEQALGGEGARASSASALDPRTDIGHVHLKVADLDRAIAFYRDVLGFELTARLGSQAAFLSAGGYHHHIGLNTWQSRGGPPPSFGSTGLYHFAIRYPSRVALARALRRLIDKGHPLDGASDHAVSEALYLQDPDGNGVELYWDRPRETWDVSPSGEVRMTVEPLDLDSLLAEAEGEAEAEPEAA